MNSEVTLMNFFIEHPLNAIERLLPVKLRSYSSTNRSSHGAVSKLFRAETSQVKDSKPQRSQYHCSRSTVAKTFTMKLPICLKAKEEGTRYDVEQRRSEVLRRKIIIKKKQKESRCSRGVFLQAEEQYESCLDGNRWLVITAEFTILRPGLSKREPHAELFRILSDPSFRASLRKNECNKERQNSHRLIESQI